MIGDYLGNFIYYDNFYEVYGRMRVARILVILDTRLGFLKEMNLQMPYRVDIQPLDYEGIPFHRMRCHALDPLVEMCPHPLRGSTNPTERNLLLSTALSVNQKGR